MDKILQNIPTEVSVIIWATLSGGSFSFGEVIRVMCELKNQYMDALMSRALC